MMSRVPLVFFLFGQKHGRTPSRPSIGVGLLSDCLWQVFHHIKVVPSWSVVFDFLICIHRISPFMILTSVYCVLC